MCDCLIGSNVTIAETVLYLDNTYRVAGDITIINSCRLFSLTWWPWTPEGAGHSEAPRRREEASRLFWSAPPPRCYWWRRSSRTGWTATRSNSVAQQTNMLPLKYRRFWRKRATAWCAKKGLTGTRFSEWKLSNALDPEGTGIWLKILISEIVMLPLCCLLLTLCL